MNDQIEISFLDRSQLLPQPIGLVRREGDVDLRAIRTEEVSCTALMRHAAMATCIAIGSGAASFAFRPLIANTKAACACAGAIGTAVLTPIVDDGCLGDGVLQRDIIVVCGI